MALVGMCARFGRAGRAGELGELISVNPLIRKMVLIWCGSGGFGDLQLELAPSTEDRI